MHSIFTNLFSNKSKTILLVFCIFVVELTKAVFVLLLPSQRESTILFFLFYFLQIIAAPVQGSYSDKYCRKNSLVLAFFAIILSLFFLVFSLRNHDNILCFAMLILGISIYGILGNANVIARAAIVDLFSTKNESHKHTIKIVISLTFFVLPIAWILIALLRLSFLDETIILTVSVLTIICALLVATSFDDKRDYDKHVKVKSLYQFIGTEHFGMGFFGLFLTQISFQLAYLFQDDNIPRKFENFYTIGFAIGMLLGVAIQGLSKKKDKHFILFGIRHSVAALIILLTASFFVIEKNMLLPILIYFYFSIGSGYYLPRFYILYSKGHLAHEQGKLFGLIDSILTVGEVTATSILFLKISEQEANIISIGLFIIAYIILQWKLKKIETTLEKT